MQKMEVVDNRAMDKLIRTQGPSPIYFFILKVTHFPSPCLRPSATCGSNRESPLCMP